MTAMINTSAATARILLDRGLTEPQRAAKLRRLADAVSVATGELCPECGCASTESNGHAGRWAEYRCTDCDHRFGPGTEA